jgi:multiple antibiotic resistance protein
LSRHKEVCIMRTSKAKSRLPPVAADIRNWITGRYSRVLRLSILVLIVALISLAAFRLITGGVQEYLAINSAVVLTTAIQLFAIMNPISAIPLFLSFTSQIDRSERQKIINTTTTIIIALLFIFSLFGPLILEALNVSVASFKLGGGFLLLVLAIDMLSGLFRSKSVALDEVAVVPLATPLLVGPGTLTTLIVLSETQAIINVLFGAIIAVATVYLTLRFSPLLISLLGNNGVRAIGRIMSVILAAVAAQMIHSALYEWGIAVR